MNVIMYCLSHINRTEKKFGSATQLYNEKLFLMYKYNETINFQFFFYYNTAISGSF
jgi:hypothetical protein